jgi:hypothetical protein
MATDDKKTGPAPKNGAVEKKAVAAKETRANRRTRRRQMPTDRRLRAVRKLLALPQVTVGARAKNPFRKHIGITRARSCNPLRMISGGTVRGCEQRFFSVEGAFLQLTLRKF